MTKMNENRVAIRTKTSWTPTETSFKRFLGWIDDGAESHGQSYLDLRQRLVAYFDRKGCLAPDDLADETLNRVNRRLEEEGEIVAETPAKFCYITARFVFLEYLRSSRTREVSLDALEEANPNRIAGADASELAEVEQKEAASKCLEKCVEAITPDQRDAVMRYYHGERREKIENRRKIAESMGISINALSIRMCRLREKLESCLKDCMRTE